MSTIMNSKISMVKVDDSVTTTKSLELTGESDESYSVFGDEACGEPLLTQHLVVDFTPIEDFDVDYVQRKCCAFWEFLGSRPDLCNLMVLPDNNTYKISKATTTKSETTESENSDIDIEKTAVSMLSFVEDRGLIDRTFEAKLPRSMCSLGSREYAFNDSVGFEPSLPAKDETACTCSGVCNICSKKKTSDRSYLSSSHSAEARGISKEMRQWDAKHPKSMDPPGHPPSLDSFLVQKEAI